ncbi:MAG TPA: hypothetical protein VIU63_09410 [Nitrospira sp.]
MTIRLPVKLFMLISLVVFVLAWATPHLMASDQLVEGAMILAPDKGFDGVTKKTTEDTMKACLARIPSLATAGQRMLAEQSCEEEEAVRQLIPPVR